LELAGEGFGVKKVLMTILAAGLLVGCASTSGELSPVPRDVGVAEARRLVASGQVVPIDMRSPHEYSTGHIPGAVLVPFGSGGTAKQVRRAMGGKQGLIYCRNGKKTRLALQELSGIPGILHFPGGITEWKASGGPIESGIAGPLGAESGLERQKIEAEHKTDVYDFF
jgi:rhodanese-related sulfurtransferase